MGPCQKLPGVKSAPEPGTKLVKVFLHLETRFGSQRIQLDVEPSERETRDVKSRLTSGPVTNQLQRAVVWAFSCLNSTSDETQQQGYRILDVIDELERWVCLSLLHCFCLPCIACKYSGCTHAFIMYIH